MILLTLQKVCSYICSNIFEAFSCHDDDLLSIKSKSRSVTVHSVTSIRWELVSLKNDWFLVQPRCFFQGFWLVLKIVHCNSTCFPSNQSYDITLNHQGHFRYAYVSKKVVWSGWFGPYLVNWSNGLLVKNPQFFLLDTNIENLPLIPLPIYKKIFFSGSKSKKKNFWPKKNHVFGYSEFIKAGTPKCF